MAGERSVNDSAAIGGRCNDAHVRAETEDSASGPVDPGTVAGKPARLPLDARPRKGLGSWPVIVVGLVVTLVGFVLTSRTAPCGDFHVATQFSGSDKRAWRSGSAGAATTSVRRVPRCSPTSCSSPATSIAAGSILRRWWPLYQAPRLKRAERLVVALPFVTGALDVAENVATWIALGNNDRRFTYPENLAAPTVVSTLAWLKMLAYGVGLLCVAAVCLLAFARRKESAMPIPRADRPVSMSTLAPPADLGVCCSGGGIRAAAFALGALDQLERAGIMDRARWLAAVSGGNYAATSWTLARAGDKGGTAAADVVDWLNTPDPVLQSAATPVPAQRAGRPRPVADRRPGVHRLQHRRARRPRRRRRLAGRAAHREPGDPVEVPRVRRRRAEPTSTYGRSCGCRRSRCSCSRRSCCWCRRCRRGRRRGCGVRPPCSPPSAQRSGCSPSCSRGRWPSSATGCAPATTASGRRRPASPPSSAPSESCGAWRASRCSAASRRSCPTSAGCCSPSPPSCGRARSPPTPPRASGCCRRRRGGCSSSPLSSPSTCSSASRIRRSTASTASACGGRSACGAGPTGVSTPRIERDQITWEQLPATNPELVVCCAHRARRHRPRRVARRHVHDLASRGVHRRLRHAHRSLPRPPPRRPRVRARRGVVDGDVGRRLRLGDGSLLPWDDERPDGRAEHRPRASGCPTRA